MNATALMLASLLSAPVTPTEAIETGHPLRVTNERGTAVIFTAPSNAVTSYIANRHLLLDQLAQRLPDTMLEAQISFSRYLDSRELMEALDDPSMTVRSLDLGSDGQSGGFTLRKDERLEDGLARLNRYHGDFMSQTEESRRPTKEKTPRPGGVLFFGARVTAPASRLRTLRDRAPNVRLVDPLWDELSDASGVSNVRKISIPLVPDVE